MKRCLQLRNKNNTSKTMWSVKLNQIEPSPITSSQKCIKYLLQFSPCSLTTTFCLLSNLSKTKWGSVLKNHTELGLRILVAPAIWTLCFKSWIQLVLLETHWWNVNQRSHWLLSWKDYSLAYSIHKK